MVCGIIFVYSIFLHWRLTNTQNELYVFCKEDCAMTFDNSVFLRFILLPIIIGIGLSAILFVALLKANKKRNLNLRNYAIGYGACVAISLSVLITTFLVPILWTACYIIIFVPFMFFSFMLNKKLIKDTKLHTSFINFIYKSAVTILIWFVACFPLSLIGITEIAKVPEKNAAKQEFLQLQQEISNYETYADLTPFGLGIYKLRNEGDRYLWDITKPKSYYYGTDMVYEYHSNCKDYESWDNSWGNSNAGKNVLYDVFFYEGTYLIVTPIWEKPGSLYYWGYIYLCKDINSDADLFDVGILDTEVVEKLRELPGEKLSRKELSEKLGKAF